MLAGVEFSRCAIHTSVIPCETQSRISVRYGFRVAFVVVTSPSLLTSLESPPMQELDHRIVAWLSGRVTYADVHALVPLPDTSSMPSGHAWIAAAAATVLWVVIPARRVLGVHYPSDVLAGAAGGVATGLWCC